MNSYEYIDGNGNVYAISSTSIVYDPITPIESSTGTYSGGEPYFAAIEPKQYSDLVLVFNKCIDDPSGQSTTRSMGTGTLIVLPKKTTYIFEMNSSQKRLIEDAIKLVTQR